MSSEPHHEHHDHHDVEAADIKHPSNTNRTVLLMEAGALLLLWSVLVINEGAIRFVGSRPYLPFGDGQPARGVIVIGALLEVVFGLIGVFVGVAAFFFKWQSSAITKLAMVAQTLMGYYVFIVFVFLIPAYLASNLVAPFPLGLTEGEAQFLIVLGILTSFHFCLALQGGQFVFFARIITGGTGEDFLKQKSGAQMRAIFWNGNMAFAGLWTTITGGFLLNKVGGGIYEPSMPYVSPPNVGRIPGLTLFTGLLLLVWGLVGMAMAVMKMPAPSAYYLATGAVYIVALLNYGMAQFGKEFGPGPDGGAVALHNGLVFMVVTMGPYFVHLADRERQEAHSA